jgi:hypothetical protein
VGPQGVARRSRRRAPDRAFAQLLDDCQLWRRVMIVGTDVVDARSDEGDDTDQHSRNRDGNSTTMSLEIFIRYSTITRRGHAPTFLE